MRLTEKVLEIYQKYYICHHCLGRMFALLGTNLSNFERANALLLTMTMDYHKQYLSNNKEEQTQGSEGLKFLSKNASFSKANDLLEREGLKEQETDQDSSCYLCNDLFSNLEQYEEHAKEKVKDIEFDNLLVGCSPDSAIINREDKFKAEFNLLDAESFKSHFNRALGRRLSAIVEKPPEFAMPDVVFIFSLKDECFTLDLNIRSLFISGRYNKLVRGIPQTRWLCGNCRGKGCKECEFTGKKYQTSVEELIFPEFLNAAKAEDSKFHGAGREDIDVRMLGTGRPFILELRNPKIRTIDLDNIAEKVNNANPDKIKISDLNFSDKKEVIEIKDDAENTRKIYKATVVSSGNISKDEFQAKLEHLKDELEEERINQLTPNRVIHRRADLIRMKKIFKVDGKYIEPNTYEFTIETQGGTYIKELISGDNGRTKPSFSDLFSAEMTCKELDVISILS